jgi:multidrug transporter EmrE-like cation transporter
MNITLYILLAAAAVTSALPMIFAKLYAVSKDSTWLVTAALSYAILTFCYIQLIDGFTVSSLYPLIKFLSIVGVTLSAIFLFEEALTPEKSVGLLFGLGSVYLLSKN